MLTPLHWIDGPWRGKLAVAARPRGGDWLDDEIANWQSLGIHSVVSFLTPDEEADLGLGEERLLVSRHGMEFVSVPIRDRDVPSSDAEFLDALHRIAAELADGRNVALHCRQGIGRSGLAAASLLVLKSVDLEDAIRRISRARGAEVPETATQRQWLDRFADSLAAMAHE